MLLIRGKAQRAPRAVAKSQRAKPSSTDRREPEERGPVVVVHQFDVVVLLLLVRDPGERGIE